MQNVQTKVLLVSIITNFFLIIIKIVGGLLGNCISVVVSGIHSISDLITDIFSVVGVNLSNKPADQNHPFGHGKIENIFSLVIGIFIIIMGLFLLEDIFKKEIHLPSVWLLGLIFITIIVRYLCSNYIMKKGIEINSNILISNAKESKMDVISSFFLLLVVIISQFSNVFSWLKYIDIVGGLLISLLIVIVGFKIVKSEISELIGMQEQNQELINDITSFVLNNKTIKHLENIHLLKYGRNYVAIFKVYFNKDLNISVATKQIENLEKHIKEKYDMINTVILKMDYLESDKNARITRSRNSKKDIRKKIKK